MIETAVVPVAGRGTRLLPATRAVPKALLPLVDRPVVDLVIEELAAAGVRRVVMVVGELRDALERHFAGCVEVELVEQPEPLGLGDAVLRGASVVDGPVVVALGDALIDSGGRPAGLVGRLVRAFESSGAAAAVAVEDVPRERVDRYGIVDAEHSTDGATVRGMVEKPDPASAPSTLAIAGRYVLGAPAIAALRSTPPGRGGEIQLTDALAGVAPVVAVALRADERRLDVGDAEGYAGAFLARALSDPRFGKRLSRDAAG